MTPIPAHDLSAHRHAEGQTPQWTRRPPDPPHPWHIGLPVSGSRCGHRQSPGTGGSRGTLPPFGAGAHRARSRRRGSRWRCLCDRVLAVRRSRPASPTPACASRTGPRLSSASGCAWTAPISAPPPSGWWARQTGVRRGRHQAAAGGLRGHLQELRRRVREALPATRIRPLGTCPASSKAHAQDEVDYAGCITTHLRRWGAARATLVRIRWGA